MLQLWVNLHSLKDTGFSADEATVVIVHADEIHEEEIHKFTHEFSKFMSLRFLNRHDLPLAQQQQDRRRRRGRDRKRDRGQRRLEGPRAQRQ